MAVPRWRGERKEEVRYNLLERVSLVHEEAAEDHGHGQSCAMQFNDPALSTPKKSREGRGNANNNLPAERNTICIVGGTLNANTILFSSVPDAKVVTWSSHCVMGTWRGLNRSGNDDDGLSQVMKDGTCWAVMKSICENVSAGPVTTQSVSQSETPVYGASGIIGGWGD